MKIFEGLSKYLKVKKENVETLPAANGETERKKYTEDEIKAHVRDLQNEVIESIGEGEFNISYAMKSYGYLITMTLDIGKNDPVYNSLFRDWYLGYRWTRTKDISYNIEYEGLRLFCEQIAEEYNITAKLTDYSVEHILVKWDVENGYDLTGYCGDHITNKQTIADLARKKAFSW